MSDDAPSIGTIAGQLGYLFEERPRLAQSSAEELAEQLNHEDRFAHARQTYVRETDEFVAAHLDEFPPRITTDMVEQALRQVHDRG